MILSNRMPARIPVADPFLFTEHCKPTQKPTQLTLHYSRAGAGTVKPLLNLFEPALAQLVRVFIFVNVHKILI